MYRMLGYVLNLYVCKVYTVEIVHGCPGTLDSGIYVGQGINLNPGKFVKINKRMAWKIWQQG